MRSICNGISVRAGKRGFPVVEGAFGDGGRGDKPGKALRQFSQAVEGVEVGALAVAGQRLAVQLDAIDGVQTGDIEIAAENADMG